MTRQYNGATTQPIATVSKNMPRAKPKTKVNPARIIIAKNNHVCRFDHRHNPAVKEINARINAKGIRLALDFLIDRF